MPNKLQPGKEIVPGYVLVRRLGAGGSGEVWVARASGGVEVAIKVIRDLALIASDRELDALRVVREAKHPNLCPMFGVWFFDNDHNLLSSQETELILGSNTDLTETVAIGSTKTRDAAGEIASLDEGTLVLPDDTTRPAQMVVAMGLGEQTLMDRLLQVQAEKELMSDGTLAISPDAVASDNQVGIDADELMRYMSSAASAIDELNERHNIYHCDIKPQNILLVGGQAQVCDFGLARKVEDSRQTTIAFGTPAYGAPEMLFERTYSKTIDQYSLAVTYYELRTGKLPYSSVTQSALLRAKASGEVDLSRVSPAEREVLSRATDLDPETRYENCQAMVAALQQAIKNPDEVTAKPTRSRAGIAARVAAVSAVALLTALGFFVPWGSLKEKFVADYLPPSEPVDPTGTEVDPVSIDAGSRLSEGITPDTTVPVPQPPRRDINEQLLATLSADAPNPKRLSDALAVLQTSDSKTESITPATMLSLVEGIETETNGKLDSGDESIPSTILRLCSSLIPIAKARNGNDRSNVARLELSKLTAAARLAENGNRNLADQDFDSVREYFNNRNEFAYPPASYRAAKVVASRWLPRLKQPNWDRELADADIARAQTLGGDAKESDPALVELNHSYLIALLAARPTTLTLDSMNEATVRTARTLEDHPSLGSLARSAISLVDPTAKTYPTKPLEGDSPVSQETPNELRAMLLLGAGWNHWNHNQDKDAVGSWKQAADLSSITSDAAKSDRTAAASYLLDWLLDKADVPASSVSQLRYDGMAAAIDPVLAITKQLAEGDDSLAERIEWEQFICSVAAGDQKNADASLSSIESASKGNTRLNRQQGRALFDLSMQHAEASEGKLDPAWANRLIRACNAQADPILFAGRPSRPERAAEARDELFQRCFKPAMDRIRVHLSTPELIAAAGLEQDSLSMFCDRLVSLLTESDRRADYGSVAPCMEDIELAASIAGRNSDQHARRSELFFHAASAHARIAHEELDDRPYSELIVRLREYRDQSKKFGANAFTNCLDAMVSLNEAFREVVPKTAFDLHVDAIAKYSTAINSSGSDKHVFLSFAHAGRALAHQRAALMQPEERKGRQLDESIEDARLAVKVSEGNLYEREYALENLARVYCAVTQITEKMEIKEKQRLIADANDQVEQAIAIRKNKSLDHANLQVSKLFVRWIDTLITKDTLFANASIQEAVKWVSETEKIGKEAKSPRLMCKWYFYAAMVHASAEEWDNATDYLITARQLSHRHLETDDRETHRINLAYVSVKSERLAVGSRQERLQLIDELTKELNGLVNPTPPIVGVRDEYLRELETRKAALR